MKERKNSNRLIDIFMREYVDKNLTQDEQAEIYNKLAEIAQTAKLEVVEDAEKAIGNLRVFSLR